MKQWVNKNKNIIKQDSNNDNKKFKMEVIGDSAIYLNKFAKDYILKLYSPVF